MHPPLEDDLPLDAYFQKVSALAVNAFVTILKEQTRHGEAVSPESFISIAMERLIGLHPEISRLRGEIFHLSATLVHAYLNPSE